MGLLCTAFPSVDGRSTAWKDLPTSRHNSTRGPLESLLRCFSKRCALSGATSIDIDHRRLELTGRVEGQHLTLSCHLDLISCFARQTPRRSYVYVEIIWSCILFSMSCVRRWTFSLRYNCMRNVVVEYKSGQTNLHNAHDIVGVCL